MPARPWLRWLLLSLILLAFGRLVWRLDAKNLWWDESLSLQRAESDWPALLAGRLVISDGHNQVVTTDQHPFGYFVLLGLVIRVVRDSEFSLRFLSAAAGTLLVPMVWRLARRLARASALPRSGPTWAALLVAASPFFLWYGQEARPYLLWTFLGMLSTYILLLWTGADDRASRRRHGVAYAIALAAFLSTHYFSVFLLPVHAVIVYRWLVSQRGHLAPARAKLAGLLAAGGLLALGLLVGLLATWVILGQPGSGANFASISLRVLVPDLINAFSLGLSVDIARVRWLDLLFAALALIGAGWGLRSRQVAARGGWLLPSFVLVPVIMLMLVNALHPAYMNARHMSLISAAFLVLVGAGLALLWEFRRWAGGVVAVLLVAGMTYSTWNYFTLSQYAKDDFAGLGAYLGEHVQPGDLVLLEPPEMLRLYRYYLPMRVLDDGASAGLNTAWEGTPLISDGMDQTYERLEVQRQEHRRVWLVVSGMYPLTDPRRLVGKWLNANAFRVREQEFRSASSSLRLDLFLPKAPVASDASQSMQRVSGAVFGARVRLSGYAVGEPIVAGGSVPVTLFWQAMAPIDRRYKYILRLEEVGSDGTPHAVSITEREPYDGALPTTVWQPGQTISEYSEVTGPVKPGASTGRYRLVVQMYDSATLVKLPVANAGSGDTVADAETLILPYEPSAKMSWEAPVVSATAGSR